MSKKYTFNGFGFPVILSNVSFKKSPHGDILDVNTKALGESLFQALVTKPTRFSGAEVRFIRQQMGKTQQDFATWLLVERSTVAKWEKNDLKISSMESATELVLRMKMAMHLNQSADKLMPAVEPAVRGKSVGIIQLAA